MVRIRLTRKEESDRRRRQRRGRSNIGQGPPIVKVNERLSERSRRLKRAGESEREVQKLSSQKGLRNRDARQILERESIAEAERNAKVTKVSTAKTRGELTKEETIKEAVEKGGSVAALQGIPQVKTSERNTEIFNRVVGIGGENVFGEDVTQGTLPLGSPTAVAGLLKGVPKAPRISPFTSDEILTAARAEKYANELLSASKGNPMLREAAISKLSKNLGVSQSRAVTMANNWDKLSFSGKMKSLIKPVLGIASVGVIVATTDMMITWYALDNVADGLQFIIPAIEEGIGNNGLTAADARDLFDEADILFDLAIQKVDFTAERNPIAYGFRKLIVKGANFKKEIYDLKKDNFILASGI